MDNRINKLTLITDLFKVLITLAILGLSVLTVMAGDQVTIKGKVIVAPGLDTPVNIWIFHNDTSYQVPVRANGSFEAKLATGVQVLLRFEQCGAVDKEVVVNTKNVYYTNRARRANKLLQFDVQLVPQREEMELTYLEPVGYISFLNGSGLMQVAHLYHLASAAQLQATSEGVR